MDKDFKVQFSPEALEQLSKMSEEDREALLLAVRQIERNPYDASPVNGTPWLWAKTLFKRYRRRFQLWWVEREAYRIGRGRCIATDNGVHLGVQVLPGVYECSKCHGRMKHGSSR